VGWPTAPDPAPTRRFLEVLVRSKRALATLAVLAVGLGLVGADAAVADPKPAAAPAPSLDPTPTNSNEIPNLGLVKNQIKFYYGDPTSTGVASPTSPYAREVRRDETRLRTWLATHRHGAKKPALVLDVDDTALLTYNYEISEDFGFNPTTNAEFVLAERFPAVFGMVQTVRWAARLHAVLHHRPAGHPAGRDRGQPGQGRLPGGEDGLHPGPDRADPGVSDLPGDLHDRPVQVADPQAHRVARLPDRRQRRRPALRPAG